MTDVISKLRDLRLDLARRFPEREHVIDGCLAAVLAGEHVLLVGAPGTAKSALVRSIARAFGGTYFERLLTKFSTPDELFGPISLKALENDRFERVITGKLPTVQFAFCDEVFRSSSAILNSLLTLMNERLYHNDGPPIECPLVTLFGATNDLPEGGELDALSDRFLLRFDVQYLAHEESLRAIFAVEDPVPAQFLTMEELHEAQAEVARVRVSEETVDGLLSIRKVCVAGSVVVSDRRWKRSLKVVRAAAYLCEEEETSPDHLLVLSDMLWRESKEYPKIMRLVREHHDPVMVQVREIVNAVVDTTNKLNRILSNNGQGGGVSPNKSHAILQATKKYAEQRVLLEVLASCSSQRTKTAIQGALAKIDGEIAKARRSSGTPRLMPASRVVPQVIVK